MRKVKLIRITTVPVSLKTLLKGQLRFMSEQGFEIIGVSSPGEELDEAGQSEGIRTVAVEMSRKISPFKDLKSLWLFYRLCKKEKPLIVHSHTPKAGIIGMLGAKLAGVPVRMHTVAGLPLMETTGTRRKWLCVVEKLTYRLATGVYPNSGGLYDFILEHRFTRERKLKIIAKGSSNGIDTSFFSPDSVTDKAKQELKKELGLSPNDFVFIYVGRMVGDKGVNELVSAFKTLQSKNLKLLLVGQAEAALDPLKQETLIEIENNPDILAAGYQKDVRPYFSVSDALVFPSYREGFPNVVLQAGAMGLPAIATNINGCNEIVKENINGLIVPPKDRSALSHAMLRLSEDKELHHRMASNARGMIAGYYEQKEVWEELLKEYRRMVKNYKL